MNGDDTRLPDDVPEGPAALWALAGAGRRIS
jgi:hypothetical protein